MDDTLSVVAEFEIAQSEFRCALFQRGPQWRACRKGLAGTARRAGDNVIGGGEGQFRIAKRELTSHQIVECRRARAVVQQMTVDMQERPSIAQIADDVPSPYLIEHRPCHGGPLA